MRPVCLRWLSHWISTHAPLAGRDNSLACASRSRSLFQPTRPLRGATTDAARPPVALLYFNPRAPCGARHDDEHRNDQYYQISTHAPLAGRDSIALRISSIGSISTHAPLAGRDGRTLTALQPDGTFQPTRPLRGATRRESKWSGAGKISTHAPLAGRDR